MDLRLKICNLILITGKRYLCNKVKLKKLTYITLLNKNKEEYFYFAVKCELPTICNKLLNSAASLNQESKTTF